MTLDRVCVPRPVQRESFGDKARDDAHSELGSSQKRTASSAVNRARTVHLIRAEAVMRAWFILGVAFFLFAVMLTLLQRREDEEMFIRLGGRDLRSLPT